MTLVLLLGALTSGAAMAQEAASGETAEEKPRRVPLGARFVPASRTPAEKAAVNVCATSNRSDALIGRGRLAVGKAVNEIGDYTGFGYPDAELTEAVRCLSRARWLSPDNYQATFLLGVARTLQAYGEKSSSTRPTDELALFVAAAKRQLGRAYALRPGSAEVLYYLAELAVVEDDHDSAFAFLNAILELPGGMSRYRGAAHGLMAHIYEEKDDEAAAIRSYQAAIDEGWPPEILQFAVNQLLKKDR